MTARTPKTKRISKRTDTPHWGTRLRSAMTEKRMTLRKAAEEAGVAASVVDSWVGGSSPSDLLAVQRLADALGIGFSWLLTGRQENRGHAPSVAEVFETSTWFDGWARIRIERLVPRNGKSDDEDNTP